MLKGARKTSQKAAQAPGTRRQGAFSLFKLGVQERRLGGSQNIAEPLQTTFFPNRALKRRMQEHDEDILRAAATAVANASDGAQQPGPAAGGGEPSSEPAPKRSRRAR